MKGEFKGTKGFHQVMYSAGICLGVGVKLDVNYYQCTCNSILPDSDKLYEIEKDEIIANMQLYSASPDLLEALQNILYYPEEDLKEWGELENTADNWVTISISPLHIKAAQIAIKKALKL